MATPRRQSVVPGGGTLVVRDVSADDLDGLSALYAGLDDDARYRRFFSVFHPERPFFERAVAVRERGGVGLVAVHLEGPATAEALVGEASFERLPDGDGELAITVDRGWRGWLGPYLLDALLEAAAEAGVANLEADVLCSNPPMLALIRARAFAIMPKDDWTVARFAVATGDAAAPSWPDPLGRPRILVEGGSGHWRGAISAQAAGAQVLGCPGPDGRRHGCPVSAGQPCPLVGGADAIVLVRPSDREPWRAVRRAHAASGAPVFVEPADGDEPGPPEVSLGGLSPVAASALVVAAARESARAVAAGRAGEDLRPYVRRDGAPTMDPSLRGGAMRAAVGDRIVIKGHRVGEPERDCEVLEVHGEDGGPPYLVRWGDNGHEALFFPGTDASVQHYVPDPG